MSALTAAVRAGKDKFQEQRKLSSGKYRVVTGEESEYFDTIQEAAKFVVDDLVNYEGTIECQHIVPHPDKTVELIKAVSKVCKAREKHDKRLAKRQSKFLDLLPQE